MEAQKRCGLSYGYHGALFSVAIHAEVELLPEGQPRGSGAGNRHN